MTASTGPLWRLLLILHLLVHIVVAAPTRNGAYAFVPPAFVTRAYFRHHQCTLRFSSVGDGAIPDEYKTNYDRGILVPERRRFKLIIFEGGTSSNDRDWTKQLKDKNELWSMSLRDVKGVKEKDMDEYNDLWVGKDSINDAKRVIHDGKIHIAVTGNSGDALALYDFEKKKCIYWTKTNGLGPHDCEYIPKRGGYLAVANAVKRDATIELYDISKSAKKGYVKGADIKFPGLHSVIWDHELKNLWAWGALKQGLKRYEVVFKKNGQPRLKQVGKPYKVDLPEDSDFKVGGTGHGACPMLLDDKRLLLLAGKDGILQFNAKTHKWNVYRSATDDKIYSNPKGLSCFNTGSPGSREVIISRSKDTVYSANKNVGERKLDKSETYKSRWWEHNIFSSGTEEQ